MTGIMAGQRQISRPGFCIFEDEKNRPEAVWFDLRAEGITFCESTQTRSTDNLFQFSG